jgi:hypothetical protein
MDRLRLDYMRVSEHWMEAAQMIGGAELIHRMGKDLSDYRTRNPVFAA